MSASRRVRAVAAVLACLAAAACGEQVTSSADAVAVRIRDTTSALVERQESDTVAPALAAPSTASSDASLNTPNRIDDTVNRIDDTVTASAEAVPIAARTRPRSFTAAFGGDVLTHSPLWSQAERNAEPVRAPDGRPPFDFRPMYAAIRPLLERVDLAVCHLETPFAPVGEAYSTSPYYGVPSEVADALAWSGHDRCSTASNHTMDRGAAGIDHTVAVLESVGIAQSGMARHPGEIEPTTFPVNGITVSHLSYTWSYNGLRAPDGQAWRSALIEPARIVADARAARAQGAEVVVVSLHWGTEGVSEPDPFQREVAQAVTAPGVIDLVVGHHAHVLQPIERINDTWVAFGLGNIISNLPTSSSWPRASQDAAVLRITFDIDERGRLHVGRPTISPTWVDKDGGWVITDVLADLARPDLAPSRRRVLLESLGRTAAVLGDFLAP